MLVPTWADDASKALSLSANVQANLALAIYGVVFIGVMLAAPGGIQGALRGLGGLIQGFWEPRSRGPAPRAKEEESS